MKTETFYDFRFRAYHSMRDRSNAAAHPHWHSYVVRFWFDNMPDQDRLSHDIEAKYLSLHGNNLDALIVGDSSDELLAGMFLRTWAARGCVRVRVTNDERRGAEASL